jgi:signal transduction histidine kinase
LIFDISAPVLYDFGLEPALETLVSQMQERHGIPLSFHDDQREKRLHNDLKVILYHAVRELLINMVKHSKANNGSVVTRRRDKDILIVVEDDGIGFEPSVILCSSDKKECFGLFNIRERLGRFHGNMQIESGTGKGSRFVLTAPLER